MALERGSRFERLDPLAYALPEDRAARILSPALVVYLDRVRENIERVLSYIGGDADRWRPHVKTTKIPAVFAEIARFGVRAFKCATTREAATLLETLAAEGIDDADVLLAYPAREPHLARLAAIADCHPQARVSVLCEDPDLVAAIPSELGIFVDVNPGMHRTGLPLSRRAEILDVAARAGGRFRGVHYYDGHLAGLASDARRTEAFACYDRLMSLIAALDDGGVAVGEIITCGTPTFRYAIDYPAFNTGGGWVHRVSPGTVVYHDLRTEQDIPDVELDPAAVLMTRVVSHPTADIVTCDAGSKSIAAECGDPCAYVLGHPSLEALTPSEEHLPLRVTSGTRPARGTILYLVPRHVCPMVNLAEEAVLVDGDEVRIVPVAARAHDLVFREGEGG